jgi:ATP-binding cassette subfamily F protein 3
MLSIQNITYRIGGRILLEGTSLSVERGQKIGLVGRNGTGKSTLFKLISGTLQPDQGAIQLQNGVRLGQVAQEAPSSDVSLIETVLAADTERDHLLRRAETVSDPTEIAEVHTRLADIDADRAPARAARILAGLGFDEETQQRSCSEFSGGWRMRVALAGALFARPDMLLLDEPTNHLDLEAAIWLEQYLKTWPGTLLVISHDRRFLNQIVDGIAHLSEQTLTRYTGNYDRFERTRRERLIHQAAARERQEAERERIQAFVDRFRAKATKARQAQSRVKMLERMEPIASVIEEHTVTFTFPDPDIPAPPMLALDGVSVGYEADKPILRGLDLRIDPDDRIALIGANGNGKSTLVKLLCDRLKPQTGQVVKASKLSVGYFAQHQSEELDLQETAFQHASRALPDARESQVRAHLGRFGFSGDRADTKVEHLSGGEKARLLFAMMSIEVPNILFLDEPTNHLDVDAREALIQALNTFDGAVVLVSHDAHLVELIADRLWLVDDGACKPYDGTLEDYATELRSSRRAERDAARKADTSGAKENKKQARRERAQQRQATADLRKRASAAEKKIASLEKEKSDLEAKLADPDVYNGSTRDLMALQVRHADTKTAIAEAENDWLAAQEALDGAA